MKILTRENVIYKFDPSQKPAITIESGDSVLVETEDCFSHQVLSSGENFDTYFDYSRVNPATGPIEIRGAEPGDTIEVEISEIRLPSQGVIATKNGWGPLGHKITRSLAKIVSITNASVAFTRDLLIPTRPMIGVIGTAPVDTPVPCNTPGSHGGNLDMRWITEGAHVFLPVFVPGALLALGDVHAVMADGEVGGTGVECRAEVLIRVFLHKYVYFPFPVVRYKNRCYFINSAAELEQAIGQLVDKIVLLLQKKHGLQLEEAYMLASILADIEICQIVNPLKTIRIAVPNNILDFPIYLK
ncbi:MAG: acetamidase/formamidase family protein [Candidatus Bathyarchaeia archaeon]